MPAMTGKRSLFFFLWGLLALPGLHAQTALLLDLAGTGSAEQVQAAIDHGADVNASDWAGRTVLMLAAASNPDQKVIALLAARGARINARGPARWTALMMAAYNNQNPDVVLALLRAGADGRLRSEAGRTAFDYAQDNGTVVRSQAYAVLKKAQY